ncbi:Ribonuclease H-like superfamily protein [Gossypium australe]|uniref:Ribonuclease H-like superfamily protein n=1 Tax=Gossypium australe TaxID=47621 RepID=A0A5B6WGX7_9ROSI|nr:Ribonuclease H-like superfamily protein [Gossypium australe]
MGWRVGSRTQIQISGYYPNLVLVFDSNQWKEELIQRTFHQDDAARILCIPLPLEKELDKVIWRGEASGVYTVRSGYKKLIQTERSTNLQQNQILYKPMYKELWKVNLLSKTRILVWKTLNNFLPTFSICFNAKYKIQRLAQDAKIVMKQENMYFGTAFLPQVYGQG